MGAHDLAESAAVTRILGPSGRPVGTGFLIGPRLVATCAHTVAVALDADRHRLRRPYVPVAVDFPGAVAGSRMLGQVRGWVPVYAGGCGDIAVLELDATPPALPLAVSRDADSAAAGRAFRMLSIADPGPGVDVATGRFGSAVGSLGVPEMHFDPGTGPVSDRRSGAPVFDAETGRVVGMARVCCGGAADGVPIVVPIADVLRVLASGPAPDGSAATAERSSPASESETDRDVEPAVGVYGLRTFRVIRGKLAPVGVHGSRDWRDGTCVARCDYSRRGNHGHRAPDELCTCGVYCFRDLWRLRAGYPMAQDVVAVIALEGRVLEGEYGWRAEAARVLALWERVPATVKALPHVTRYRDVEAMIRDYPGIDIGSLLSWPGSVTSANSASAHRAPLGVPMPGPRPRSRWAGALFTVFAATASSVLWAGFGLLLDRWVTHTYHLGEYLAAAGVLVLIHLLVLGVAALVETR